MIRSFVNLIAFSLLLIGLGCVWILVKIGGKSDGPGALMFYIGAVFGVGGAAILFWLTRPAQQG